MTVPLLSADGMLGRPTIIFPVVGWSGVLIWVLGACVDAAGLPVLVFVKGLKWTGSRSGSLNVQVVQHLVVVVGGFTTQPGSWKSIMLWEVISGMRFRSSHGAKNTSHVWL